MPYRFLDHTADVAVEVRAETLDGLFVEALRAFTDTVTEVDGVGVGKAVRVEVEAGDLEGLLVEWLGELVYLFDVDRVLFREGVVEVREVGEGGWRLVGEVRGEVWEEGRHVEKVHVKAVTWHGLEVREVEGGAGWLGRVVFDI